MTDKSPLATEDAETLRQQLQQLQTEYANLQTALQMVLEHSVELESHLLKRQEDLVNTVQNYQGELEEKRQLLLTLMDAVPDCCKQIINSNEEEESNDDEDEDEDELLCDAPKLLTPRQHEILRSIAEGKSNKQIAYALNLSEGTIKQHTKNIFRCLNVRNRVEAIAKAQALGEL